MEFIKAEGKNELEAVANRDPLIKKAVARLMELSADEKTRLLYEAREKERMDNESREDWARQQGMLDVAKNLLAGGKAILTLRPCSPRLQVVNTFPATLSPPGAQGAFALLPFF
jgi:hypothetical protein